MKVLIVFAFILASCVRSAGPACTHLETRCHGKLLELCDSQGRWQEVADCATVEPGSWTCNADEETCEENQGSDTPKTPVLGKIQKDQ